MPVPGWILENYRAQINFKDVFPIKVSKHEAGKSCVRQVLYDCVLERQSWGKCIILFLSMLVPYLSISQELVFSSGTL